MDLSLLDYALVALYFVGLFAIGLAFARKKIDDENYLLGARRLTLPLFVMSLVTTWYGAILGVGEFVFYNGIVAWVVNGLLWYFVYLLFALFLAGRVHRSKKTTVADHFLEKAGPKSAKLAGLMTFIMSSPAPYVLSLSLIFRDFFGIGFNLAVLIALGVSALYIWLGGFKAVVRTDAFQFIFMFLGFGALTALSIQHFGGFEYLQANLPETHLTFKGELSWQTIVVWGFIAFWTFVDPSFYQRCYAAGSEPIAKKGVLISIVFWMIFDMMTLTTGLYARAAFPEGDPQMSYFLLSDAVLPHGLRGLFLVGILSIIMSTLDAFLFASSSVISVDFLKNNAWIKRHFNPSLKTLTRVGILFTLLTCVVIIYGFESVIGIIYALGTVGVATLLAPLLLMLFGKSTFKDRSLLAVMTLTALASTAWLMEGWLKAEYGWPSYRYGIEPMYIGIGVSLIGLLSIKIWNLIRSFCYTKNI